MELCRVLVRLVRGSLLVPRARLFVVQAVETLCGNQKGTSFQEMVGARNLQSLMMTLLMLTLRRQDTKYTQVTVSLTKLNVANEKEKRIKKRGLMLWIITHEMD